MYAADKDILLSLYYEGGSSWIFEPIDVGGLEDGFEERFFEAVLSTYPDYAEALSYMGSIYTKRGEYARGLEIDLRLARLKPRSARVFYNLACSYALLGKPDEAFDALEKAVERGFSDAEHLARDEDLKSLRDDPRFKKLLERVKKAARRANA